MRIIYLLNMVLVTLCFNQSVCADERLDNYEQQLGQMQQQLSRLKTIELDIEQFEKQLDFQGKQLSEIGRSVTGNEKASVELRAELQEVSKKTSVQLIQVEKDITSNEHKSAELNADLTSVKKQLESGTIKLESGIQSLDKKLSDELTNAFSKLEQNGKLIIGNQQELTEIKDMLKHLAGELGTRASLIDVNQKFTNVNEDVSSRTLYLMISIVILVLIILFLKHRFSIEIIKTRGTLESDINILDLKLSEYLEEQMNLASLSNQGSSSTESTDIDHSLPLKVATEIHRMSKRIDSMSDDTKGIRPLAKALERLVDSLAEQNYEVIKLLDQKYIEGMTVNVVFIKDEKMPPGEKKITNVIKPQVNYKGVIVQVADIEVSTGE